MICNECKSDAEFKQFSTFSYYYCQTCKVEVTAQPIAQDSWHPKLWTACKHNRFRTEYCTDCKNETIVNNTNTALYTDPEIKQLEELFSTLPDTIIAFNPRNILKGIDAI